MSFVVLSAVTGRTHLHWHYRTFNDDAVLG